MKLDKVKFLDASGSQELTKEEQKMILGGYDGKEYCWWEAMGNGGVIGRCACSSSEASTKGTYHWECNTSYAKEKCMNEC